MKILDKKFSNFVSFVKTVVSYPSDTIREKSSEFKGATLFLVLVLALFVVASLYGFYSLSLKHHVTTWSGKIAYVDLKPSKVVGEAASNVIGVERQTGDTVEVVEYSVSPLTASALKKDMKVRKPFFYTDMLFGDDGVSFSMLSADALFFIVGLLLLAFVIVCGSSFITIIFASIFMVRPKYAKKH